MSEKKEFVPLESEDAFEEDWKEFNKKKKTEGETLKFALKREGEAVGYWRALFREDGVAYLKRLLVKKEFRGKGYGRLLAEHFEEKARERKSRVAWVMTFDKNENVDFYENLGYELSAEAEEVGVIILTKRLTSK